MEIPVNVVNFLNSEVDPLLTEVMTKQEKVKMASQKGEDLVTFLKEALEDKIKQLKS
jgi:hypothetical protein